MTLDHLLFVIMSLIWGATWIATKAGLAAVPPFFFGAARYVLVSAVLVFVVRDLRNVFRGRALRLIVTGMLVVVATYALIYWGMQYVASGVSGVVNMSMNPVCLFGLAILLGQERPTWRHALALIFGIAGLVLLFSGKATMTGDTMELWGALAYGGRLGRGITRLLSRVGAVTAAARSDHAAATDRRAGTGRRGWPHCVVAHSRTGIGLDLRGLAYARAARRPALPCYLRHIHRLHHFPAADARLGRLARRALLIRLAGRGADRRCDRLRRAAHLA